MYENENKSGVYPQGVSTPPGNGWHYSDGRWQFSQPGQPAGPAQAGQVPAVQPPAQAGEQKPRKKTGRRVLAAVAMVLACAIFGFGGGYAAVAIYGSTLQPAEPTVIYKAPEDSSPAGTSGVNKADGISVSDIAEKAGQSVVSITTENQVNDYFLGNQVVSGGGSGIIISEDGYIITNNHVVDGANSIVVTLPDGTDHQATLVGRDERTDIAVVKIDATGLVPAVIGNSSNLRVGEFCMAIGNPLGTLGGTVTDGIISALDRVITIDGTTMNLLQMNAAVSPGNSGGGLFNSNAELIGVVNAKNTGSSSEGLGFAIPVNTAIEVANDLINHGYVTGRPGLGINVLAVTNTAQARQYGISLDSPGLYITSITAGSAAEKAGLQVWDRIVSADGTDIAGTEDLQNVLLGKAVGDELELVIARGGTEETVTVTLGELTVAE